MSRRSAFLAPAVVTALVLASAGGYVVGRGDRAEVPDLYGSGRGRSGERKAYVMLKKSDLRLGRTRLFICGGRSTRGMIVEQFPAAGESVPVGSAVDIWTAVPEGELTFDPEPGDQPCEHP